MACALWTVCIAPAPRSPRNTVWVVLRSSDPSCLTLGLRDMGRVWSTGLRWPLSLSHFTVTFNKGFTLRLPEITASCCAVSGDSRTMACISVKGHYYKLSTLAPPGVVASLL